MQLICHSDLEFKNLGTMFTRISTHLSSMYEIKPTVQFCSFQHKVNLLFKNQEKVKKSFTCMHTFTGSGIICEDPEFYPFTVAF